MNLQSLLPLAALLLSGSSDLDGVLSSEAFASLSESFGFPAETVKNLTVLIPRLLRGEIELKSLIPAVLPVLIAFFSSARQSENAPEEQPSEAFMSPLKLDPISGFADESIYSTLEDALSESAS